MPTPIEAEVKRILRINGRGEALRRAFQSAWSDFEHNYPDRAWWRRKSTQAAIIWEYAVKHAIEALGNDVVVVPHHDTISFIFDDALLVRMKKADVELMSRNYPTALASLFHEPEVDLFGYKGLQRVEVVYVRDQYGMGLDWIGIVARENDRVLWHFELEDDAAATVEKLPITTQAEASSTAALATLKKDAESEKKSGGESE